MMKHFFDPKVTKVEAYNTIQYNIVQYNTIQYNLIQYNTIQKNNLLVLSIGFFGTNLKCKILLNLTTNTTISITWSPVSEQPHVLSYRSNQSN